MHILLTNDDGIHAHGLQALHKAFTDAGHTVTTVAPATQQSAVGSALSLRSPLRIETVTNQDFTGYAVKGTPVDCVKIGLHTLVHRQGGLPDIVVSGMNAGRNIGVDILYSGTIGAAMEGARQGIASIAISHSNYNPTNIEELLPCARHLNQLIERLAWKDIPKQRVLSLNYPNLPLGDMRGLQVCAADLTPWHDIYEERQDLMQIPYWLLGGYAAKDQACPESDHAYLAAGWITLSALSLDLNDRAVQQMLTTQLCP